MKWKWTSMMAVGTLALAPLLAFAQAGAPAPAAVQPPVAQQQAALDPALFLRGAAQTLAMLDQGRIGEVWDGGSAALKQTTARDAFVSQIRAGQAQRGASSRREWVSISVHSADANGSPRLPQGRYVSVAYSTAFAKGVGREVVSFRQEQDGQWRVTGYVAN